MSTLGRHQLRLHFALSGGGGQRMQVLKIFLVKSCIFLVIILVGIIPVRTFVLDQLVPTKFIYGILFN